MEKEDEQGTKNASDVIGYKRGRAAIHDPYEVSIVHTRGADDRKRNLSAKAEVVTAKKNFTAASTQAEPKTIKRIPKL